MIEINIKNAINSEFDSDHFMEAQEIYTQLFKNVSSGTVTMLERIIKDKEYLQKLQNEIYTEVKTK